MFRELLGNLEATLVHIAQETRIGEHGRAMKSLGLVLESLNTLSLASGNVQLLTAAQRREFEMVKRRILVYLFYYDWLIRFVQDPTAELHWQRSELLATADQNDWIAAAVETRKMISERREQSLL